MQLKTEQIDLTDRDLEDLEKKLDHIVDDLQRLPSSISNKNLLRNRDTFAERGSVEFLSRVNGSGHTIFHQMADQLDYQGIEFHIRLFLAYNSSLPKTSGTAPPVTISELLSLRDHNNLTPLSHACIASLSSGSKYGVSGSESDSGESARAVTLSSLLVHVPTSTLNTRGSVDGWSPLHWLAFNGDLPSIRLLRQHGARDLRPDKKGRLAVDIAGEMLSSQVARALVSAWAQNESKECLGQRDGEGEGQWRRFARYRYLYWAAWYGMNEEAVEIIKEAKFRFVLEFPLHSLKNRTVFHACCFNDNLELAIILLKLLRESQEIINAGMHNSKLFDHLLVHLNHEQEKEFDKAFIDSLKSYPGFVKNTLHFYYNNIIQPDTPNDIFTKFLALNTWESADEDGNTVLHLSTLYESHRCAEIFLREGADILRRNRNHLTPTNIVFGDKMRKFYKDFFKQLGNPSEKVGGRPFYFCSNWLKTRNGLMNPGLSTLRPKKIKEDIYKIIHKEVTSLIAFSKLFQNGIIIPDFAIEIKNMMLSKDKKTKLYLNALIKELVSANYKVYFFRGSSPHNYYIAGAASDDKLINILEKYSLSVKLLNHDVYVEYFEGFPERIAPFTPSTRQELISYDLHHILDLSKLKKSASVTKLAFISDPSFTSSLPCPLSSSASEPLGSYFGISSSLRHSHLLSLFFALLIPGLLLCGVYILRVSYSWSSSLAAHPTSPLFSLVLLTFVAYFSSKIEKNRKNFQIFCKNQWKLAQNDSKAYLADIVDQSLFLRNFVDFTQWKRNSGEIGARAGVWAAGIALGALLAALALLAEEAQKTVTRWAGHESPEVATAAKGAAIGLVVWALRASMKEIVEWAADKMEYVDRYRKEEFRFKASYISGLYIGLIPPMFILFAKRFVYDISATDVESIYFLLGYVPILLFLKPIINYLIAPKDVAWALHELKNTSHKLAAKQSSVGTTHENPQLTYRRAVVKAHDPEDKEAALLEHIELEFYRNEGDGINQLITDIHSDLVIVLSFVSILPLILCAFLISLPMQIYLSYRYKFLYTSRKLNILRFNIPFIREMYMISFTVAVLINAAYTYIFFEGLVQDLDFFNIDLLEYRTIIVALPEHILLIGFLYLNYFYKDRVTSETSKLFELMEEYRLKMKNYRIRITQNEVITKIKQAGSFIKERSLENLSRRSKDVNAKTANLDRIIKEKGSTEKELKATIEKLVDLTKELQFDITKISPKLTLAAFHTIQNTLLRKRLATHGDTRQIFCEECKEVYSTLFSFKSRNVIKVRRRVFL